MTHWDHLTFKVDQTVLSIGLLGLPVFSLEYELRQASDAVFDVVDALELALLYPEDRVDVGDFV